MIFDAQLVCPLHGGSKDCRETEQVPATYRCPVGYNDSKNGCWRTDTKDAIYECADGARTDAHTCFAYSNPSSYCAIGTPNGKGQCLVMSYADPIYTPTKKGYY
eukprot:Selendium_serpulae@DN8392_c0_g1_i1.p2